MKSLIKRKIDIALNFHVEMILQLVLDAYTLNKERTEMTGDVATVICPANMLYYRMLRQTGHTAALKKLLSYNFQVENDICTFALFQNQAERENLFKPDRRSPESSYIDDKGNTAALSSRGVDISKTTILIFPDCMHDSKRMDNAQKFLRENLAALSSLRLVVFLG